MACYFDLERCSACVTLAGGSLKRLVNQTNDSVLVSWRTNGCDTAKTACQVIAASVALFMKLHQQNHMYTRQSVLMRALI